MATSSMSPTTSLRRCTEPAIWIRSQEGARTCPVALRLLPELRPAIEAGGETFAGAAFGRPTVGDRLCSGQRTVAIPDIAGHQPRPVALCLVDRNVLPAVVDWGAAGAGR